MRNIIYALTISLFFSFSSAAAAAELPSLGKDFPAEWSKVLEQVCSPKEGISLKKIMYRKYLDNGMSAGILIEEKNGMPFMHIKAVLMGNLIVGMTADILVGDKLFSLTSDSPEDLEKLGSYILASTELTEAEYESCAQE